MLLKKKRIRFIVGIITALMIWNGFPANVSTVNASANASSKGDALSSVQAGTTPNSADMTYLKYMDRYKDVGYTGDEIMISGSDYSGGENVSRTDDLEGKKAAIMEERGWIEWQFHVPREGLYRIRVEYFPVKGTGGDMERSILIDGRLPFKEAYGVSFSRLYKDETEIEKGINGDDIRPSQIEAPIWTSAYVSDSNGYFGEYLSFYLTEGVHTLSMESVKEPMAIGTIDLKSEKSAQRPYADVYAENLKKGTPVVSGVLKNGILIKQAEASYLKSDPSLYPLSDNNSPVTQPFDYHKKRINTIGGNQWKYTGQWISWKIDVPKTGFYHIGFRFKQDFARDIYANRALYIDGGIPFREAENLHFFFDNEWQVQLLGDTDPFLFQLEKGEHEIKLKVAPGDLKDMLIKADEVLDVLNDIDLKLVALMGATPDSSRDYQIDKYMPDVLKTLSEQGKILDDIITQLVEKTNNRDSLVSELEQLSSQIRQIVDQPYKVAGLFSRFRSSVGALGNWVMDVKQQPLSIDYIFLAEKGANLPKAEAGNWENLKAGLWHFIDSFSNNYLVAANADKKEKPITVWIGSGLTGGRDQAMALSKLVNQKFIPESGIPVNLQLVPGATILSATLAGRGPDVALQLVSASSPDGQSITPVEFAMRNAVCDLSKLEGFHEVMKRFPASASTPYEFQNGTYALPETFVYPMMFCRTDILSDLNIDVNRIKTWDDVVDILPLLQAKNMTFALPSKVNTYSMFLYQMGGDYYYQNGKRSALDGKIALDAFKYWMDFYTEYGLVVDYSFENRFRTGEMPIGIADYTSYNLLSISAPEINGLWTMIQIPGLKDENGNINNVAPSSGAGCVLMSDSPHKEEAWEFMKWWTSSEIQYSYGRELEAVMGPAARYNTANMEALKLLSWSTNDRNNLFAQSKNLKGIPQVPGGYYTERNLNFAKLAVLNKKSEPRQVLMKYVKDINTELRYKRKEFKLSSD